MITLIFLFFQSLLHPFHVSVSDIKYKEDKKAIQMSTRLFLDDLELAIRNYTGNNTLDIVDPTQWDFVNENLKKYLLESIELWDEKDKPYELTYVGAEIVDDVMWCYLEVQKVKKIKKVKVRNKLLVEVWGDQENLVHFRAFDQVKSARLFKGEDTEVFEWE